MISEGTKICPECSESIQAQALVCRFCGYDYRLGGRQAPKTTNGMAVASMVLGIVWIYWIGSILALIFGYMAKRQIGESGNNQAGRGFATAGIVLGWVGIGTLAIFLIALAIGASNGSFQG